MNKTPCKNTMEWFKSLSGIEETEECLKFVLPSIISLQNRVKRAEDIVDEVPALSYAAALLALYRANIKDELLGYESLKAGDITLKSSDKEKKETIVSALNLAISEARPYLKSATVFRSIGGGSV